MKTNTVLLTGVPRSGTSLACRLLDGGHDALALSEPLRLDEIRSLDCLNDAVSYVDTRISDIRRSVLRDQKAPSTHFAGQLSDARVSATASDTGLRAPQGEQGEIHVHKSLSPAFQLFVKHNALFTALLQPLSLLYRCVAIVRNPLAVLASWHTVDLPVNRGRVPVAEQFDVDLRETLKGETSTLQKQVDILDWFFARYIQALPAEQVVRYEDVVDSGGMALYQACSAEGTVDATLSARNDSDLYRDVDAGVLLSALLDQEGSWRALYTEVDLESCADALRG
ncbi:MAG: hypothetical protein AAGI24_02120 [Pseudomonadota bacterium]